MDSGQAINEKEIIKINSDNFYTLFSDLLLSSKSLIQILLEIGAHSRSKLMVVWLQAKANFCQNYL